VCPPGCPAQTPRPPAPTPAARARTPRQAPDVYLEALRRLGAASPRSAARALVIEDAIHGLASARAAGAYAIAVATSLPAGDLAPHADRVVSGLGDLAGRLAELAPGAAALAPAAANGGGGASGGSESEEGGERKREAASALAAV
jgi:hypothetical protein